MMTATNYRHAVIECDVWGDTWQYAMFDLPDEVVMKGTVLDCIRFIDRNSENGLFTNYVIVRLDENDCFTADDIVWAPYDAVSRELMKYNKRVGDGFVRA